MTAKEIACLKYMSGKMGVTSQMVGEAINPRRFVSGLWEVRSGAVVLGRLRYNGLVTDQPDNRKYYNDTRLWRLTEQGQELVKKLGGD